MSKEGDWTSAASAAGARLRGARFAADVRHLRWMWLDRGHHGLSGSSFSASSAKGGRIGIRSAAALNAFFDDFGGGTANL